MFTRILCPIDFNGNSFNALRTAARLAQRDQAKLYLLHVVAHTDTVVISAPLIEARTRENAAEELRKLAERELAGVEHESLVRFGHPAAEILEAEREIDADLVVMATHGRVGVPRVFLGSVTEKVVRESSCPVLVVRLRPLAQGVEEKPKASSF